MRYLEPVFRPPSEAYSYILQVTYGCSHNACTFCGMYRTKQFKVRPFDEVREDIEQAARRYPGIRRVFLADGDAMILKTDKLIATLDELGKAFVGLERVGTYADARGINSKTGRELLDLRARKLGIVYLGLESGNEDVLASVVKGVTAGEMTESVHRGKEAGIKTSVIALLGLAGKAMSEAHAADTARVISAMSPDYFSALTLTLVPGTELAEQAQRGDFQMLTPEESLEELYRMVEPVSVSRPVVFRTNHASNYVTAKGTLPDDKKAILHKIRWAIEHKALRPESMRGL
jgi:radical SAM superfamily enzyme YgiQ (UPF0313 family)